MASVGARLLLIAAALLYGVAALGNGLDRWSMTRPQTKVLPAYFAALSLQRDGRELLVANRLDQAIVAGSKAVAATPLEPGAISLLGAALLGSDQSAKAKAAFEVSARLGWRDIPTEAYWATAGVALEDQQMIAQHLDALMRMVPTLPQSERLLQTLESTPKGQQQLAGYLALGPDWLDQYAKGISRLPPDLFAVRLGLLRGAKARGKVVDCGTVADAINDLAYSQGRFAEAAQLWQLTCRSGPAGLVFNPDFTLPQRERDLPFEWAFPGTGGVSAGFANGRLSARNENPGDTIVAQQYVLAPAGPVRLKWTVESDQGASELGRSAALLCPNRMNIAQSVKAAPDGAGSFVLDLVVPPGCSPQLLVLRAPREAGEVRFSSVSLELPGSGQVRP